MFLRENKELILAEYVRLVKAAERNENQCLFLVLQTICATGIRVSELPAWCLSARTESPWIGAIFRRRKKALLEKLRSLLNKNS